MSSQKIDYAALAEQARQQVAPDAQGIDYAALAEQARKGSDSAKSKSVWERLGIVPSEDDVPQPLKSGEQAGPTLGGSPGEMLMQGLGRGAKTAGKAYVTQGPGQMLEGAGDITRGDIAKGGHKAISGAMVTALPIMPEVIAANPLMAARAMAGGYVGGKAAQAGTAMAGGNEEQQQFAGDLGNLAGGFSAASGLPRALFESAAKSAMNKVATSVSGSLDPDVVGLISPRLAHLMRMAGKVAEVTKPPVEATASGPVSGEATEIPSSPYRLSGKQIQDATTVTPRRILGPERQLPASADAAPTPKPSAPAQPDYKLPNATYLRPEMRSLSQQPPEVPVKPDLLKGIREHEFLLKVQDELNRQGGDEQAQKEIDDWIEQHNRQTPGGKAKPKAISTKAPAQSEATVMSEGESDVPRVPQSNAEMETLLMKSLKKYGFKHDPATGKMVKVAAAGD